MQEFESCPHYELTYEMPEYNPSDTCWAEHEAAICAWLAKHLQTGDAPPMRHVHSMHLMHSTEMYMVNSQSDPLLNDVSSSLIDHTFLRDMQDVVRIHSIKTICKEPIDPHMLASNWGIGIETTKRTLKVTTQCGVWTVLHPTLS